MRASALRLLGALDDDAKRSGVLDFDFGRSAPQPVEVLKQLNHPALQDEVFFRAFGLPFGGADFNVLENPWRRIKAWLTAGDHEIVYDAEPQCIYDSQQLLACWREVGFSQFHALSSP
jgi:hypothetical protein